MGDDLVINLKKCLQSKEQEQIWFIFTYLLWEWWKMRNDMHFNQKPVDLTRCWWNTKESLRLVLPSLVSSSFTTNLDTDIWIHPQDGQIKINCDGSYKDSHGSAAAVARDSSGVIVGTKKLVFRPRSSLHSELIGFQLGLDPAEEMGIEDFILEADSRVLVDLLTTVDLQAPWRLMDEIASLHGRISTRHVSILYTPRHCNQVAHILATEAMLQSLAE